MSYAASMHIQSFTLLPKYKKALAEGLTPYLNKPCSDEDMDAVAQVVCNALPTSVLEELKQSVAGNRIAPIQIKNLPEVEDIPGYTNGNVSPYFLPLLSQGIYRALDVLEDMPISLWRKKNYGFSGQHIHADSCNFSQLGVLRNDEHAPTFFFDLDEVFAKLEAEHPGMVERIKMKALGVHEPISLPVFMRNQHRKTLDIDVSPVTDPEAALAFNTVMQEVAVPVDLQKGELLFWNNRKIYHQAGRGEIKEETPPEFRRWAVATMGGSCVDLAR